MGFIPLPSAEAEEEVSPDRETATTKASVVDFHRASSAGYNVVYQMTRNKSSQ